MGSPKNPPPEVVERDWQEIVKRYERLQQLLAELKMLVEEIRSAGKRVVKGAG